MDTEITTNTNCNKLKWKITLRQFLMSSTTSSFSIMAGVAMGGPTVIIPQLRKNANTTDSISDEMVSWTSSASNFAAVPWSLFLLAMAFYTGRKKTMYFLDIATFLAFLNLYLSTNITQIFMTQLILGMVDSSMGTISTIVVTELSTPEYRGILLTYKEASYFWGIWISNVLGTYFHWTTIGLFGMISAIYTFIVLIFVPESPYWLARKGKYEQCTKSYYWLRGVNDETDTELNVLINRKKLARSKCQSKMPLCRYIYKHIKAVFEPEMYKPLFCCCLIAFLYVISGKQACTVYAIDIIKKITSSEDTAYIGMLILDGITIFGMYLASALNKTVKRKTMLISATSVCIFFMYVLSIYLYLIRFNVISENNFVSIFLLVGYSLGACCGPMVMCTVIFAELIPVKYKNVGFVTCGIFSKMMLAIFLKVTPYILKGCGNHGSFLVFGIGCSIFLFLVYKYVPETKGKTMYEIAEYFKLIECKEMLDNQKEIEFLDINK